MTKFTVKVRRDDTADGRNRLELISPELGYEVTPSLTPPDAWEIEAEDAEIILYYAVERIAQLESIVESQKASRLRQKLQEAERRLEESAEDCLGWEKSYREERAKKEDAERRLAEANALLDDVHQYTKTNNLGKLGQSRVKALIDSHEWVSAQANRLADLVDYSATYQCDNEKYMERAEKALKEYRDAT